MGDTIGKYDENDTEGNSGVWIGIEDSDILSESEVKIELQRQLNPPTYAQLLYFTMKKLQKYWPCETLPDGSDAESIVHDTIMKLLKGDNKWPRNVKLSTLLYKNLFRDIPRIVSKAQKINGVPVSTSFDGIEQNDFVDKLHFEHYGHKKMVSDENPELTQSKFKALYDAGQPELMPVEKSVLDSGHLPDKVTANRLGITLKNVRNIKKRLKRKFNRINKELDYEN